MPSLQRHHRRVDTNNHDLGLMEVSRVFVFRISLLLRPPAGVLQSSSSTTLSTSSTYCCELVDRLERRFRNVARVRWLVSSLSSGTTSSRPYQQLLGQFWSHFGNPRSQLEGRKSEVGKVVGLVVGAKSELAKRFCITIKYLFVIRIPGTKRGQLNYIWSATRTSFCNRVTSAEGKSTERRDKCRREKNWTIFWEISEFREFSQIWGSASLE
jgi:hypothetical protein